MAGATELVWEGYYRARGSIFNSLSLSDTNAYAEGTSNSFDHRLLLRPSWMISDHAAIHAQVDVFKLTLWGDNPDTYTDPVTGEAIAVAQADGVTTDGTGLQAVRGWGEAYTKWGRFSLGRMPMQWGAGILWNDGNDVLAEYGDSADRFQVTSRIGPVFVMGAYDVQYEGFLGAADDMQALSLAVGYRSETLGVGVLNNYRFRPEAPDNYQAYTGDLWGFAELGPVRAELEGVGVFGGGNLDTGANDVSVMAFGLMAKGDYRSEKLGFGAEFGVASGDDDSTDGNLKTFTFDRDHNVGLLLFEEALPTLQTTVQNETNGGRTTEAALSGDGISNAVYFRPAVRYKLIPELEAEASWLVAGRADSDGTDETNEGYGNEFDLSLRYDPHPHVWVKGTFGVLLPGPLYTKYESDDFGTGFNQTALAGQLIGTIEF
jgi:limonene-1,2-epoxide hydrolase